MEACDVERPFLCEECNRSFRRKVHLINHQRNHSLSLPHVCTKCNSTFRLKSTLKRHFKTHTGERPLTCCTCNLKFRDNFHLIEHMKSHSKESPIYCEICNKVFMYKRSLLTHIRTHTEGQPFTCPACPKKFTTKGYFVRHLRIHPEKQFSPEGSNGRTSPDSVPEDHENSSPNCERTDFKQTNNCEVSANEVPSYENTRDGSSSRDESQMHMHRIENYDEGSSYEDVTHRMDITPSCEENNMNCMEDISKRPLCGGTSINHMQNTVAPISSLQKDSLSWKGIYIVEMEYPGENISL